MEFHPRINVKNPILTNKKIILGSFPTWTLTDSDDELVSTQKLSERAKNGDIPFFYGSATNKFWGWYQLYVDSKISVKNITEIEASLMRNSMGITDVIISCLRKDR